MSLLPSPRLRLEPTDPLNRLPFILPIASPEPFPNNFSIYALFYSSSYDCKFRTCSLNRPVSRQRRHKLATPTSHPTATVLVGVPIPVSTAIAHCNGFLTASPDSPPNHPITPRTVLRPLLAERALRCPAAAPLFSMRSGLFVLIADHHSSTPISGLPSSPWCTSVPTPDDVSIRRLNTPPYLHTPSLVLPPSIAAPPVHARCMTPRTSR